MESLKNIISISVAICILSILTAHTYSYYNPSKIEDIEPVALESIRDREACISIKEFMGISQKGQKVPLSKSQGTGSDSGYKLTGYSSNALYHYKTGEWRADKSGFYRAGDGVSWCYVVSANSSNIDYGTKIKLSFGTGWVLDSGCAEGVLDMYVDG